MLESPRPGVKAWNRAPIGHPEIVVAVPYEHLPADDKIFAVRLRDFAGFRSSPLLIQSPLPICKQLEFRVVFIS